MKRIGHFIGGAPDMSGSESTPVFDPASGRQTGEVMLGGAETVARAVAAAQAAA
ncbi:MAG TPA: methylmalonate-semialdehyde dehydrogenase (CoA acylating), partial [Parvularcula sp.]|nr:methylmalonate-semialdehyde dehydrogenase (CoA acylating) [Parvularcula sp.]